MAGIAAWSVQEWWWGAAVSELKADFAREDAERANANLAAVERVREEEKRRTAAVEEARNEAQKLAAAAAADAAGARNERDRLRARANALARAAADRDPAAADGGPPGAAGADLLAYMLGRVSDRAAELAAIADRARVAGLTCERIYDGLSK
ncbi:DUF2514 family protein [Bordetella avium]|nr:DUF2514 domain-containing protein [Bordetella avium]RIQ50209.1 DUF2514 family protein [Bordetella avium]RIQ71619.1 DUF2514 family protein [Bordetella avium]